MKTIAKMILASAFILPLSIAQASTADGSLETIEEAPVSEEVVEAALNLSYKSRVAQDFVEDELNSRTSRFYHSKAIRLSRTMNLLALEMADLFSAEELDQVAVDELFEEMELNFYQLDSTKRNLERRYSSQRSAITATFNDVRTAFYYLKLTIYGEI